MKVSRITLFTLIIESVLIGAFLIWALWRGVALPWPLTSAHLVSGVLAALPLIALSFVLFVRLADQLPSLRRCRAFRDGILLPLAHELTVLEAALVSCLAGIGEELFFRYLLQTELGLIAASFLFAFLHFGPLVRDYYFIASIYFVYGLYFGLLFAFSDNIWVPIVAHALYDFAALLYLRRLPPPERSFV